MQLARKDTSVAVCQPGIPEKLSQPGQKSLRTLPVIAEKMLNYLSLDTANKNRLVYRGFFLVSFSKKDRFARG